MAVKAVRVYVEDQRCNYGPIKLGEFLRSCGWRVSVLRCLTFPSLGDAVDTVKVTGDTLLPAEDFAAMVSDLALVQLRAVHRVMPPSSRRFKALSR